MALTESLLKDAALIEFIIQRCESKDGIPESIRHKLRADDVKNFLELAIEQGIEVARSSVPEDRANFLEEVITALSSELNNSRLTPTHFTKLEASEALQEIQDEHSHAETNRAVIMPFLVDVEEDNPYILIQDNTFQVSSTEIWGKRLEAARSNLEKIIPSVGRIDMTNHPDKVLYMGCGWLVATDVIVTNCHVAEGFSQSDVAKSVFKNGSKGVFKRNMSAKVGAKVDFRGEVSKKEQFEVLEVLYLGKSFSSNNDIAFLKISQNALNGGTAATFQRKPIPFQQSAATNGDEVAVIGYPSMVRGTPSNVKMLQPGQIVRVEPGGRIIHNCSTSPKSSGSVIISLKTGEAVGLHYGGDEEEKENWAIPSQVIRNLMNELGL
jgi:Trypsin-like peptidase domain